VAARTLSAVAGGSLPREVAEGPMSRVLEFTMRHPRRPPPPLSTHKTIRSAYTYRVPRFAQQEEKRKGRHLYILYKHNPLSIIYCISLDMQPVHVISMSWGPPSCPYRSQLTTPARATHLSIQVVGSRSSSNTGDGSLLLAVTILAY